MPTLPNANLFDNTKVPATKVAEIQQAFLDIRAYLNDLLGSAGTLTVARNTLDVPVRGDIHKKLLSTITASNNSFIDFTSFAAGFSYFEIEFHDVVVSLATATSLYSRVSQSASFATTGYKYCWRYCNATTLAFGGGSNSAAFVELLNGQQTGSGCGISGIIKIFNPFNTSNAKRISWEISATNPDIAHYSGGASFGANTNAIDGFRIYPSGGNIVSGTFNLYGVK